MSAENGDAPIFVPAPALGDEVQQIIATAARRMVRLLQRRGILDDAQSDELAEEEPLLAAISAASVQGQLASGERAGQRLRRLLAEDRIMLAPSSYLKRGPRENPVQGLG